MGLVPGCAYAEQVITHEREALTMPEGMDFARAATLPAAFLTASRALFLEGGLQPGQWCLVRPATAGVGLAATQLANTLGARPIGSSRDLSKLDTANDMGLAAQVSDDGTLATQLDQRQYEGAVEILLVVVPPPGVELANPGPLPLGRGRAGAGVALRRADRGAGASAAGSTVVRRSAGPAQL